MQIGKLIERQKDRMNGNTFMNSPLDTVAEKTHANIITLLQGPSLKDTQYQNFLTFLHRKIPSWKKPNLRDLLLWAQWLSMSGDEVALGDFRCIGGVGKLGRVPFEWHWGGTMIYFIHFYLKVCKSCQI